MKTEEPKAAVEEGTRSFAVLLQQISEGNLNEELSSKMQELVGFLTQFSDRFQREAKGTLTLTLTVTARGNGTVTISDDVKTKTPTVKRTGQVFWPTKGNNLALENPRQQKLSLREVPTSPTRTKDISTDPAPARGL